jgi:phenylacetate-CoA ligase
MSLQCEVAGPVSESLAHAIEETLREATKLRGLVVLKPRGVLPNDGKVIEDVRKYD